MRCLKTKDGIVTNVERWGECPPGLVESPATGVGIGWTDNGDGTFSPPIVPEVPKTQEQINAEHRAYLASTDWYITRKTETGEDVPQDILDARQAAREGVVE